MTLRRAWRGLGGAASRYWNYAKHGGEPGEPVSARAWIEWPDKARRIDRLFPGDPDHCRESARRHLDRAHRTIKRYTGKI